jgi:hypothetical protein
MTTFGFAHRVQAIGCLVICAAVVAAGCNQTPQSRRGNQANLKQIGLAFLNYSTVNKVLPFPGIGAGGKPLRDPADKPLLSWRVALLPFLEQDNLYKQFHLNEPWDSEHNKRLITQMPLMFMTPGGQGGPGETHYRIFSGPKALKPGMTLATSHPGASNAIPIKTILVVEASEPVIWTKPDEIPYDPAKPLPKLGLDGDGFNALFALGNAQFISRNVDERMLRAAIDPSDTTVMPPGWEEGR